MSQLTGIPKPPSPFRRVDVPAPQQQQQPQSSQRRQSSGLPQHYRPQPPVEQPVVPPSTNTWAQPQNPPNDPNSRSRIGSMNK